MQRKVFKELEKWYIEKGKDKVYEFIGKFRGKVGNNTDIFFAFSRALIDDISVSNLLKDDESIEILFKRIDQNYCDQIREIRENFSKKELQAIILNMNGYEFIPSVRSFSGVSVHNSLYSLVYSLLDIKDGDVLFHPYIHESDFLIDFSINYPKNRISAMDINTYNVLMAKIKSSIVVDDTDNISIKQDNFINSDLSKLEFNKFFSLPPMGVRYKDQRNSMSDESLMDLYDDKFRSYDDWINILKLVINKKIEKAVFIVPSSILFSQKNREVRKYLLENKYVEAIIELPEKMLEQVSITTNIIILSNNNESIKMLDASKLYINSRNANRLSEKNISQIIRAYDKETEISRDVSLDEIVDNDYSFLSRRYTNEGRKLENYLYLKDVATIKRGYANLKQSDLNDRKSEKDTGIKILTARDIDDDFSIDKLINLENIEENEKTYCAHKDDILIARAGTYKSTIIRRLEDKNLIINGTLYIITCDTEKINPYYLQMYLTSQHCLSQIEALNAGTVISFISISQLGELKIPKIPKNEEDHIAKKYKSLLDRKELLALQKKQIDQETIDLISEVIEP